MLDIVAGADCGDFVDDQIGRIGQLAARHGNEAGIGKPVSLADADIDDLAFRILSTRSIPQATSRAHGEAQPAEHLELLATELLDPEFVRMHRALVDECDAMPRPRKHGRGERSREAATDDRDVCDDRRSRSCMRSARSRVYPSSWFRAPRLTVVPCAIPSPDVVSQSQTRSFPAIEVNGSPDTSRPGTRLAQNDLEILLSRQTKRPNSFQRGHSNARTAAGRPASPRILHRHDIAPLFDRAGARSIWHIRDAAVPQ